MVFFSSQKSVQKLFHNVFYLIVCRVSIKKILKHQIVFSGVDFMSGGQPLSLAIILSPDFPKSRPNIFVEPRSVRHPWLREDGAVVGAPGKQKWFLIFLVNNKVRFFPHSNFGKI